MTIAGFSKEDIEATIDPEIENYMARQNNYRKLFSSYFENNDITNTEWFKSQSKKEQNAIKNAIQEFFK